MTGNIKTNFISSLFLILFFQVAFAQNNSKFKVVLDPGHGGNDFGAVYHGFVEKNNALNVALKVGKILEKDPNIQVIYTRKTDVFIELDERANIANRNDANIFVSIHCNANKNTVASGTETYVMGVTRNASNLEVAKKENAVVTMESDYKMKYDGYDPNSPESLIGMTLLQEEYIEQSIDLAARIQDGFENGLGRKSRGVKQAGFLVLRKIYMPRVLIEMGFVSNKEEGAYLSSDNGQEDLAKAIGDAILSYKKEYFVPGVSVGREDKPTPSKVAEKDTRETKTKVDTAKVTKEIKKEIKPVASNKGVVFKVQISASGKKLDLVPGNFKGLNNISMEEDKNIIKYFYGQTKEHSEAKELLAQAKDKGFTSAFIVAYKDGKKITIQEALK
ncbi:MULTISPECIES: N-acetylmuramoyl-L-alanine amidase [Flavobacterium]|mgnify:CR=1 FL=1|uniref:N-acetylmuramoyl-L-alanine amidase family protein n=1 Tax=Flavobacterium TaxID=237 RepID=UPI00086FA474|nr:MULTISPECIES: N-acetylmuramoyl-L-alanine amidase [Flavobacterium]MBN9284994.1 N-acetylmuramoyl-L-alanine amidase [Flavobacterium sp.]ODS81019.1 MAG: N-acetylmuramoyl-L-alanine amidase [Chryseobacterium sp. SCN 40-13]OJV72297.1 MAG: N-acetylmuramoyl-L-alanine amidase [Flavobacterium sp. 40-81]